MRQSRRATLGFTLLEVLVSMAIFAIIGLGANQMLRTVIKTHDRTQAQIQSFSTLTRAFAMMERDFSQAVPRSVRDEYGEPLPALMVATGAYPVELTRTGWNNPLALPRSELQRVAYEFTDKKELRRHFWLVLDRAEDSEPITQVLLDDVLDFRISVQDKDGNRTDAWPDYDATDPLPLSIELLIELESMGTIRKVFSFPLAPQVSAFTDSGANDTQEDTEQDDSENEIVPADDEDNSSSNDNGDTTGDASTDTPDDNDSQSEPNR